MRLPYVELHSVVHSHRVLLIVQETHQSGVERVAILRTVHVAGQRPAWCHPVLCVCVLVCVCACVHARVHACTCVPVRVCLQSKLRC